MGECGTLVQWKFQAPLVKVKVNLLVIMKNWLT